MLLVAGMCHCRRFIMRRWVRCCKTTLLRSGVLFLCCSIVTLLRNSVLLVEESTVGSIVTAFVGTRCLMTRMERVGDRLVRTCGARWGEEGWEEIVL